MASAENGALTPPPFYSRIARLFARQVPRHHLTYSALDETISRRAWTNYLSSLDFQHVYFLNSDIETFRSAEARLGDRLREGDIQFAYDVFHIFKQRLRNRYEHVGTLLERGFDLEKDETYRFRGQDAPWAEDEDAWDEIWRRKIKNEYLLRVIAGEMRSEQAGGNAENGRGFFLDEDPSAPPEEVIRKRYKQVLSVLEDSDEEWVLQKYLNAFAHAYDPHSGYMSFSDLEDFDIEMKLSLVGIGALLRADDGAAKVVRLIPGGPADRDKRDHRLQPGDRIIAVADGDGPPVDIRHQPLYKVVRLIRGERGTKVVLTVVPASDPTGATTKNVDLVRDEVKLEEQAANSRILYVPDDDGVERLLGVVELPAFYANLNVRHTDHPEYRSSSYDVQKELEAMKTAGVRGIALDLRNNGGGSLHEAIKMTGLFIGAGATVQVAERTRQRTLFAPDPSVVFPGPLIVLVNRFSASASEIVAGALQDYGRAIIVGDSKTHGKGTVQSLLKLGWDRRLGSTKVTTASYYRVTGASTQLRGIESDIVLPSPFDTEQLGEESLPNAIGWSTIEPVPYTPVTDLAPFITRLKTNSMRRRDADAEFVKYRNLLEQIRDIRETKEAPLALAARRMHAASERELSSLRERLAMDRLTEDEPDDEEGDLVLRETLRILADFVAMSEPSFDERLDIVAGGVNAWLESAR